MNTRFSGWEWLKSSDLLCIMERFIFLFFFNRHMPSNLFVWSYRSSQKSNYCLNYLIFSQFYTIPINKVLIYLIIVTIIFGCHAVVLFSFVSLFNF